MLRVPAQFLLCVYNVKFTYFANLYQTLISRNDAISKPLDIQSSPRVSFKAVRMLFLDIALTGVVAAAVY